MNLRPDMSIGVQVQDREDSMRERRNNNRNAILQMRRQAQLEAENPTLEEYIREHNIDEDDVAGIVNKKDRIYTKNAENYIRDPILLKFRNMCQERGLLTRSSIVDFIKRVKKSIPQEVLLDDESEEEDSDKPSAYDDDFDASYLDEDYDEDYDDEDDEDDYDDDEEDDEDDED